MKFFIFIMLLPFASYADPVKVPCPKQLWECQCPPEDRCPTLGRILPPLPPEGYYKPKEDPKVEEKKK
jgi:hypothetical protein